ncbi:MAG TPA: hypothetical protein VHC43_01720 [Mycobacteriales bacterium]|nr:hypothetical protein [Mycobacteriales bacterium]
MNSPLGYDLAKARVAELQRSAARTAKPSNDRARMAPARSRSRQRAGWWLISVGLRLVATPPSAAANGLR